MGFPSFLQRPLTPKGVNLCSGLGLPCPSLSLVCLSCCRLLPPCSPWGQEPRVPGPQHPPGGFSVVSSPPGSHWHPLGSVPVHPVVSQCGGHASPILCCGVSPTTISVVRAHPGGQRGPWGQGARAALGCKRTQSTSERPLLPFSPGSALVSHHLWDSALFCSRFSSS